MMAKTWRGPKSEKFTTYVVDVLNRPSASIECDGQLYRKVLKRTQRDTEQSAGQILMQNSQQNSEETKYVLAYNR